jgi:hypothetical protein
MSPAALSAALGDATTIGATWIRVDLAWDDIQSSPNSYAWQGFDRVVAAARARHLEILAMLAYTPAFARPAGCTSDKCGPANPAQFAAFAAAAVRRYAPEGVTAWEIWNEPNSGRFWKPSPQPARFASLVRLTAAAIRKVEPDATIVLGSLAAGKLTGFGTPALTFLEQACRAGVSHWVDAVGFHPYTFPTLPTSANAHNPWNQISSESESIESVLASAGTPDLPVWVTEFGAPTSGPGPAANGPPHNGIFPRYVTEAYQARLATAAVQEAAANPHVATFFWYTDRDTPTNSDDSLDFFGLRTASGSPKPAFFALERAVAALRR